MAASERRTNQRVPANLRISCIHEGDYLISHSKDLSVDGMFICSEPSPAVGDETKLTFSLEGSDPFTVNAKVVWVNNTEDKKDNGIGVQFLDPSPQLTEAILKIVNRVAILDKKNSKI